MMKRAVLLAIPALLGAGWFLMSETAKRRTLGPQEEGGYLVPTGWIVKPAGRQIPLDTFPMASVPSPDGKYLLVLNGGYKPPSIAVLKADTLEPVSTTPVRDGWLGLSFSKNGKWVYVGGGSQARVFEFGFEDGKLAPSREIEIVPTKDRTAEDFTGDVAVSPDGRTLFATELYRDAIAMIDTQTGKVTARFKTGRRPYRILFHPDGQSMFVSSWADGSIYQHRAADGERINMIRVAPHTTDMVLSNRIVNEKDEDGDKEKAPWWKYRLFVTAGNTNNVFSLGISEAGDVKQLESISIAMTPRQPAGMTPSALALTPDQKGLFVVCSDGNTAAAVDLTESKSRVTGFIPTGWYPIAARVMPDRRLIVFNGRGERSKPNPNGPRPVRTDSPVHQGVTSVEYVGRIQTGSASVIDPFTEQQLAAFTKTVYENSPYKDELLDDAKTGDSSVIPARPGMASPIKHVIYVLKENRTYDQVLGDMEKGNGDKSLVLFGEKISPNHHKLAEEFVLLDNFYVNADVSADGHNWSTAAIAPDYVQRMWPNSYGGRRKKYDYEGGEVAALPPAGYLWTNAASAGVSMRNYGFWGTLRKERAADGTWVDQVKDPVLARVTNRKFPGFNLDIPDVERARIFLEDLAEFEKSGSMPSLILLRIGNDHTSGTAAGKIAPLSAVADNDYALGMIVEAVTKSRFWKDTALFVIEDDAQNGADHVDSHRSPAFVISPFVKRNSVDSTIYNQASVLRTMELILGLRPMTQFDAAAKPMFAMFQAAPDLRPYAAEKPRISLEERNPAQSATAARSARLDLSEADRIDDDELNDILWTAIRGTEPPVPVRSFFAEHR